MTRVRSGHSREEDLIFAKKLLSIRGMDVLRFSSQKQGPKKYQTSILIAFNYTKYDI